MAKNGPIILVEDDPDDQIIISDVLKHLQIDNEIKIFGTAGDAWKYLINTPEEPFIVLCDVNLPGQNGLEFKRDVDAHPFLRKKSIPFIFLTTAASQYAVNDAYMHFSVQGFFQKPTSYDEFIEIIKMILRYWKHCKHPNNV